MMLVADVLFEGRASEHPARVDVEGRKYETDQFSQRFDPENRQLPD
jgi:hypothetical protein